MKHPLIILLAILLPGCHDHDADNTGGIKRDIPPFVLNENCNNDYYVRLKFADKEVVFSEDSLNHSYGTMAASYSNIHGKGNWFKNNKTKEELDISFFIYDIKTVYTIDAEDYRFINPLNPEEGIYLQWLIPVEGQAGAVKEYIGTNNNRSYFYITHVDDNKMCGEFRTNLKYCCGDDEFEVSGDFSMPTIQLP
jgi:hypothetical protein